MYILAHRGYHADAPENTLDAFAAAVALGVDGIETDVRLSADNKLVIVHDRVSPKMRAVAELTHRELEVDAGYRVPLLAEVLDAFPAVLWNIEIKTPSAWPAAARVLAEFQRKRRLMVTSFRHEVVMQCAEELEIACGLLLAHRPLDVAGIIAGCLDYPRINAIVWDYNVVDEGVLRVVSAAGWRNYVYGAATLAEHTRSADLGLAGLITDHPHLMLASRA